MKIIISSLALLLLFSITSFAQSFYNVKGAVVDTAAKARLLNTIVMVLNAKDSILQKFTRADAEGNFAINNLPKGKYLLVLLYPEYADYSEPFTLDSANKTRDFGKVNMVLKSRLLQDIIIKGEVTAIKIKGDTTEFNARAYTIQPNDKVEDLIKQFPGIQVDKDGKITAQGQVISKVLVDGEEFFGDDPTLVTKNLRADMVDKVQLFDKKSDQATFTGIDDGVKTKTLNIKLKEDKKNGYFGKADAGIGNDGYYHSQLIYNRFTAKQKFSLYGTLANNGQTGLGFDDNSKYGSASLDFQDNGIVMITGIGTDDLDNLSGRYDGRGFPVARSAGVHFDSKLNKDKASINTNYKVGSMEVNGESNIQTKSTLQSVGNEMNRDQTFNNYMFRQKLDLIYQTRLDSTSNLKITTDGTDKNTRNITNDLSVTKRPSGIMLNQNDRRQNNNGEQKIFNVSAFYTKKFKKVGRTLSVLVNGSYNKSDIKGTLYSKIDYYNTLGVLDKTQLIDQYITNNNQSTVVNSNFTYTEPLSKTLNLSLNYGLGISNSTSDRKAFDQSQAGKPLVDSLSINFKVNQLSNQGGAIFNYNKGKTVIIFGTKIASVTFKQDQFGANQPRQFNRSYVNWMPQASYIYKFGQRESLNLRYSGSTTQPGIDQLQPVRINTDPLSIFIGNPDLKPTFTNRVDATYSSYKQLTGHFLYATGGYSLIANPIANNSFIDTASGKNISQAVNINNNYMHSFNFYTTSEWKVKPINMGLGFFIEINGSNSYGIINNELNVSTNERYSVGLTASKFLQKKYDLYLRAAPAYAIKSSKLRPESNANGWQFTTTGGASVYLPGKFQISTDVNYQYQGESQAFGETLNRTIWNATLYKSFLKEDKLKLSFTVNDILNQNTGFNRTVSGTMLTQTSYTTIKRYFMIGLAYDFTKFGTTK